MRRFLACLFLLASAPAHAADVYTFDKNHTNIVWSADHFGFSRPSGKWMDVDGKLTLDEQNPVNSKVEAVINIASLTTGLPKFDEHLRNDDFFRAGTFPQAKFVSTRVEVTGEKTAKVYGDLTLLGQTRPVVLDVTLNKIGMNMISQKKTAGFSATTSIKRSDFGMNYAIPGVSDQVDIAIETELNIASK